MVKASEGDMRKAVMYLQSASKLYPESAIPEQAIFSMHVKLIGLDIAGILPEDLVNSLLAAWIAKDFTASERLLEQIILIEGYSATQLLTQLLQALQEEESGVSSSDKSRMGMAIAKADRRLIDGCDEHLQMLALVSA